MQTVYTKSVLDNALFAFSAKNHSENVVNPWLSTQENAYPIQKTLCLSSTDSNTDPSHLFGYSTHRSRYHFDLGDIQ